MDIIIVIVIVILIFNTRVKRKLSEDFSKQTKIGAWLMLENEITVSKVGGKFMYTYIQMYINICVL